MKPEQEEAISQIHHCALETARLAHLCVSNDRVGREWLLQMSHHRDRISQMIDRLEARHEKKG